MADRWAGWGLAALTRRLDGIDRDGDAVTVRATWTTATGLEIPHTAAPVPLRRRRAPASRRRRRSRPRSRTSPGSARCSSWPPGHEAFEWFGRGPHETYPDRKRGGRVGRWWSTITEQLVRYVRPQENGGHADMRWFGVSDADGGWIRIDLDRPGPGLRHPRHAPPTSTPRDTTSSSGHGPRRSSTSTPRIAASGRRAAARTRSSPYVLRGGSYRWTWTIRSDDAIVTDPLGRGRPRVAPPQRPHQLRDGRPRERLARPPPRGRPAARGGVAGPPRPATVRRVHQPGRRADRARGADAGRRRLPGAGAGRRGPRRLDRPRPALRRATASPPASRTWPASRRRTWSATTRPRRSRSTSSTSRPACGSRCGPTLFADRPAIARSLTLTQRRRGGADRALRDVGRARPPGRRLAARHAERCLGARAPRRTTGRLVPGRQSVGSLRGTSGHEHSPFLALRRGATTEDAGEALRGEPRLLGQLPRRGGGRSVRDHAACGSASIPRRSRGGWSRATRSPRPRP